MQSKKEKKKKENKILIKKKTDYREKEENETEKTAKKKRIGHRIFERKKEKCDHGIYDKNWKWNKEMKDKNGKVDSLLKWKKVNQKIK